MRQDKIKDFSNFLDDPELDREWLRSEMNKPTDDGWTIFQLAAKKGLHDHIGKLLEGDLLLLLYFVRSICFNFVQNMTKLIKLEMYLFYFTIV